MSFPNRIDDVRDVLIDANICVAVAYVGVLIGGCKAAGSPPATSPLTEISPEVLFPDG